MSSSQSDRGSLACSSQPYSDVCVWLESESKPETDTHSWLQLGYAGNIISTALPSIVVTSHGLVGRLSAHSTCTTGRGEDGVCSKNTNTCQSIQTQ